MLSPEEVESLSEVLSQYLSLSLSITEIPRDRWVSVSFDFKIPEDFETSGRGEVDRMAISPTILDSSLE
jgi:hypothetical protein